MKNFMFKKGIALLLTIAMVMTLLVSIVLPASAATTGTGYTSADQVVYKTSGNYRYNWGAREEDCVFLSKYAQAFYTGNFVFEDMSKTQGGTGKDDAYKSDLYAELQQLMKSNHKHINGYSANNDLLKYTDCIMNDTAHISSFYSGKQLSSTWGTGWNKEHTWPNSKGLGGSDEDDVMMIRPTATSENSGRGNTAYGQSSGYYNPNGESKGAHDLRGDTARITLYVYTRWGNTSYMWGTSGVMESLDVLLQWMEEDPVDTWEMGRNDAVQSITGTRNVYVDYPEYAWLLFGQDVPADLVSPSGNKGATGGNNTGSVTGGTTNNGGSTGSDTTYEEMSISDALNASDGTNVTVTGTITSIDSQYPWKGTSMSANIGDGAGNELYLYKLSTEVKVGDNVTISGMRYTYNGLNELKDITSVKINSSGNTSGGNTSGGSTGGNTGGNTSGGNTSSGNKTTYLFSDYAAGTQWAMNEVHVLDDTLTVTTNDAHFTTQLRLYHSDNAQYDTHHATAIFASTKVINSISVNAGFREDVLKISGSVDGNTWTVIDEIAVTAEYADYNVDIENSEYKYIKLESTTTQIRVASVAFEYVGQASGGNTGGNTSGGNTSGGEMSIADALATSDGTVVTVKGTVTSIGQEWSTKYNDMSFTISDGTGEIYIFRSKTQVNVGDSVTVTGTRATYNDLVELKDCTVTVNLGEDTDTEPDTDESNAVDTGANEPETDTVETGANSNTDTDETVESDSDDETETEKGGLIGGIIDGIFGDKSDKKDEGLFGGKLGCGSSVGGGIAVIISVSLVGIYMFKKKED